MTAIDWAIVAFALLMVPFGYRQGMIVSGLTLAGFAAGAFVGARVGPLLLSEGSASPYAPAGALLGGLLLGGLLAVLLEGIGRSLRGRLIRGPLLHRLDAIGGAAVLVVLALAISWVAAAVVLNTPDLKQYREDVQRSVLLSSLNEALPPSGPILNVLNRIDLTPAVVGPSADVSGPRRAILDDPEVQRASVGTVRVLGTACGLNVSGSGWVAAPETVVTNAHVVAGEDDTRIETRDGTEFGAVAAVFRPRDDLAILRVPGLPLEPLPLADAPEAGTPGAVAGFPGVGEFTLAPARLGTTGLVSSQDSYGRGPIEREMTSFRGKVENGNSGGPVISDEGEVLTTVFASTLNAERAEGLGIPNSVVARRLRHSGGESGTGDCA